MPPSRLSPLTRPTRAVHHRTRSRRRDSGEAVEMAVLAMVGILLVLAVIQAFLYFGAVNTAHAAAQAGLQSARTAGSTAGAGKTTATTVATTVGGLNHLQVRATRTITTATVTVTGHATSLIPGLNLPVIEATAEGAVERFTFR